MYQARRGIFLRKVRVSRRVYVSLGAGLAIFAVCVVLLGLAGTEAKPPQFQIGEAGLLKPAEYPLWQHISDWIAGRRYVLLTFDDGPYGHGVDEQILATLKKNHAHAIFFEVCAHINNETIGVPRDIVVSGSLLGNHSFSHLHLPRLRGNALDHQIMGCSNSLDAASGTRPRFLRPPWGQTSPAVLKVIHSAGMQQVLWNANSGDSWLKDPHKIINLSLKEVALSRASILLMHSRPTTANALGVLLADLQQRGVRFILPVCKTSNGAADHSLQTMSFASCH